KEKIDIYDIPINHITKQYMDYIYNMEKLDLQIASDFILMAATLLEIKSKMLLPKNMFSDDEGEEDPREELVKRLLEYKKYKDAANLLKDFEKYESKAYYKPREDLSYLVEDLSLEKIDLTELLASIKNIISSRKVEIEDNERKEIRRDKYNIKQCSGNIISKLTEKKQVLFTELLSDSVCNNEIVTYFLSILELIRVNIITVDQADNFSDILIIRKEGDK
ncbi:MAG TPA: segregation/condensation protein A, partial [Tissierellaceae bacterium]